MWADMHSKFMVAVGIFYQITLLIADNLDLRIITQTLAVTAGIIGLLHVAYDAVWKIKTTRREKNQSLASYAGEVVLKTTTTIVYTIFTIIITVVMFIATYIVAQLFCFMCILIIALITAVSVDKMSQKVQKQVFNEEII